jgi:hypothetical protein
MLVYSPIPPKIIGKKACLQAKGPSGLIQGPWTQKTSKHLKEGRIKGNRGIYMEVGKGGVQCSRYNGQIACSNEFKIQRILGHHQFKEKVTCRTSFNKVFFMKDDLNDEVPNPFLWCVKMGWGVKIRQ